MPQNMFSSLYSTLILPTVKSIKTTPVKNQAATGTCWSFATTSFMETELLRMGKGEYDLSEMFIVRQKYFNQAERSFARDFPIQRQGIYCQVVCREPWTQQGRKNSWGTERNVNGGYLNMSESFVRAKTIYVMLHKDALPKTLR